jgi:hypothetical protein
MTAKRIANHSREARNLLAMTVFARKRSDDEIAQQAVAQLPCGQIFCETARANRLGKRCGDGQMKHRFSTKGAQYDSPGQRPGFVRAEELRALKGRRHRCFALSGLDGFLAVAPRALPWAISLRPVGALSGRIDVILRLDQAKAGNFRGLSHGL